MDFSYLDLLASTALRENNSSQADSTTAHPNQPQPNHHDSPENEEDDDEADGKTDVKFSSETLREDDLDNMGSVKCGKPKKSSGKSVSIFVRDGKCVGKKIHSGDSPPKEKEGADVTGHTRTVSDKVNSLKNKELCQNNNSAQDALVLKCVDEAVATKEEEEESGVDSGPHLCNGVNSTNHVSLVAVSSDVKPVPCSGTGGEAAASEHTAATKAVPDPIMAPATEPSVDSHTRDQSDVCEVNGDTQTASVTASDDSSSSVPSAASEAEGAGDNELTHKEISDSGLSDCVTDRDDSVAADPALAELSDSCQGNDNKTLPLSQSCSAQTCLPGDKECAPSLNVDKAEEAMKTEDCSNCDEACPDPPAQDTGGVQGQDSLFKDNVDQDKGSSGNKHDDSSSCSVDSKLTPPPPLLPPPSSRPTPISAEVVFLDHCYSGHFDKLKQSAENTDDSGDAFESADENISADEIEHRPRSLSVDSVYLQQGQPGSHPHQDGLSQNDKMSLLSPTLSVDSISNDSSMSEHSSATGGQCYSILSGCPNPARTALQQNLFGDSQGGGDSVGVGGRLTFNSSLLDVGSSPSILENSSVGTVTPKCGKFRIGTFGSFSNSQLDLDKDSKKSKLKIGMLSDPVMKNSLSSPAIASPASPFPLLQSPGMEWDRSDAGSEAPDDLDSSTTEDKFLSSSHDSEAFGVTSSQIWNHPVFHDHDYCCKEISEKYLGKPVAPAAQTKGGKRKYARKKDRQDMEEEKLKKGKYLKRELLKQDNRFNLGGGSGSGVEGRGLSAKSSLLAESLTSKPNPVGRPRKRNDRQMEEYDAETGTKMKITGKYQDQYVYYLNKSSRNRRRKLDEKLPPGDKIILPAPKPGDIVVPHLTDAECEAIRFGGRSALLNNPSVPGGPVHLPHADGGDMDSSIVNTILSMETEHGNLASPLDSYDGDSEDFGDIEGNLTSEQVKMLFDCLDTYHIEDAATSQAIDLLTSAEDVSVPSTTVNSMAPTTVEEDFLVPGDVKTGSSSTLQHTDSTVKLNTVKAPLGSEVLSSVMKQEGESSDTTPAGNAGLPVPPSSQPSVEKNLEFLKTPITKSDFFPAVSTISSSCTSTDFASAPPSVMLPSNTEKAEDANETPWIVTVTLYWNDIPAIIINNMPHVRLVDIHRQILPAKDTGILKKRCQLMNIQVTNCTEMQRYFLVQYGRAHNSKSTLVISKDEAQRLISYYAHPPPRNLRGEDAAGLRRSSSYAELRSYMETPSHPNRLAFAQPRKRGGFRRRGVASRSHNPSPEPVALSAALQGTERPLPAPQPSLPASPVKGLRHKKINFREMLKGEDSSPHSSPSQDGQAEEESSSLGDANFPKSRGAKTAVGFHKRRRNREAAGGPTAKRGRKDQRRKDEQRELSQAVLMDQTEADILVDADSPDSSVVNSKGKKRSPGSAANGSLSTSGRSPKSKFGPIKVNVKSLVHAVSASGQPRKKSLFGRKSSLTDHVVVDVADEETPQSHPLRVLRISHQEVEGLSNVSPRMLSPAAEVHLDMYKRSTSPCVKCSTCAKFLSVPGFLQHHHTTSGGELSPTNEDSTEEGGTSSVRRRMLVPMNKENISIEDQQLWNEFVALQERLDQAVSIYSMGAYPLTPLSPASPAGSSSLDTGRGAKTPTSRLDAGPMTPDHQEHGLHNGLADSVSASDSEIAMPDVKDVVSLDSANSSNLAAVDIMDSLPTGAAANPWETPISVCSPPPSFPISATHTDKEEKLDSADVGRTPILSLPKTLVPSKKQQQQTLQRHRTLTPSANVRTSSRKRETKRLYSFEKYEFGGGKKSSRGEIDCQDSAEDLPDTPVEEDVDSLLLGSPVLPHPAGAILQESQNA